MARMRLIQAENYPEIESSLNQLDEREQYKLISVSNDALKGT